MVATRALAHRRRRLSPQKANGEAGWLRRLIVRIWQLLVIAARMSAATVWATATAMSLSTAAVGLSTTAVRGSALRRPMRCIVTPASAVHACSAFVTCGLATA